MNTPYKVRVCQVEYARDDGNGLGYRPDPSQFPTISFIDGTPGATAVHKAWSSHATQVAKILLAGPAAGLIGPYIVCDASNYVYPSRPDTNPYGLNAGRTLDPTPPAWDIINHSWGGKDPLWESDTPIAPGSTPASWDSAIWGAGCKVIPGILSREVARAEKNNILEFVALPDPGMEPYRLMSAAKSRNIVHVGSSISGQVTTAEFTYDSLDPVQWTSYASPTEMETGVAMISYLKTNGIAYDAGDLGDIFRAVQKADGKHDHAAAMQTLYAKYPAPAGSSNPDPTSTSSTSSNQTPVSTTPSPTPAAPIVTDFTPSNAWSAANTPTTLTWNGTGVGAVITDPLGAGMNVPAKGSIVINQGCDGYNWSLVQVAADGKTKSAPKTIILHGRFNALQLAAAQSSSAPATPPAPTPDQLCASAAATAGVSYANGSFSGVTIVNLPLLLSALKSAGFAIS